MIQRRGPKVMLCNWGVARCCCIATGGVALMIRMKMTMAIMLVGTMLHERYKRYCHERVNYYYEDGNDDDGDDEDE